MKQYAHTWEKQTCLKNAKCDEVSVRTKSFRFHFELFTVSKVDAIIGTFCDFKISTVYTCKIFFIVFQVSFSGSSDTNHNSLLQNTNSLHRIITFEISFFR